MISEIGAFCLMLALAFAGAQVGLSAAGRVRRSTVLAAAGEGAAVASFLGVALAFACLVHAFVTSDFSVANVAANSHTEKPLLYKVAGAWGSHEGSMLLWCLALTGYGAAAATLGRGLPQGLKALMVATQPAVPSDLVVSGSHRDSGVSGSPSASAGDSLSAPRRRCSRSAGDSVRMRSK